MAGSPWLKTRFALLRLKTRFALLPGHDEKKREREDPERAAQEIAGFLQRIAWS
jgi:hypothetical protein